MENETKKLGTVEPLEAAEALGTAEPLEAAETSAIDLNAAAAGRRAANDKVVRLTVTAMLAALIVVMAFTPLGYLRVAALSISFMMVPVAVGSIAVGPTAGAILGAIFGVTSFIQCFTGDTLGAILVAESIPKTIAITIGARVLAGWLPGIIFKPLHRIESEKQKRRVKERVISVDLVKWNGRTITIQKKSIVKGILLSIITLGIYAIYWEYILIKNIKAIKNDRSSCFGEILCLIVVPFYALYWWFTRGKLIKDEFSSQGYSVSGNETAYLLLSIFGLGIVAMAIMQNDFNALPSESAQVSKKVDDTGSWSILVASLCASLFNTLFFLGLLALLFMNKQFTPAEAEALGGLTNVLNTVIAIAASINAPIELAVCGVLGSAVGKAVLALQSA